MIKTNIKMRVTPEQSRRVQEICFENGIEWADGDKELYFPLIDKIYLIIKKSISFTASIHYLGDGLEEIDADFFIKTNGTCQETYLTKYTSQPKDLESALKKIENLHIALKKKVAKNKNQALEITKLLEQKKDLQEENSNLEKTIDNINLTISNIVGYPIDERCEKTSYLKAIEKKFENTNNELARICELNKYLKEAYEIQLQEKDTIISYLESKLK